MKSEKYDRSVDLVCPVCGLNQFEFNGSDQTISSAKCASCGREFTKEQLIEENRENISEHVREMGNEIMKTLRRK